MINWKTRYMHKEPTPAAVGRVSHQIDVEGATDCSSHEAVCPLGQRDKGNVVAAETYRSERTEKLARRRHAPRVHVGNISF